MKILQALKQRLVALLLLAALAVALLAPLRSAEAANFDDAYTPEVSWNSGPK